MIRRTVLSISISVITLSLLFGLVAGEGGIGPSVLLDAIGRVSLAMAGIYLVSLLVQAFFRAARYRLLLISGGEREVPNLAHLYLVTIARNMLVDMFPSRSGELGYVALLNRGYRVSLEGGLSSLTVSIIFDFISLLLLMFLLMAPVLSRWAGGGVMIGSAAMVLAAIAAAWWAWFYLIPAIARSGRFRRLGERTRLTARLAGFIGKLAGTAERTRASGALWQVLGQSAGVRISKYAGFYFLFIGATRALWPELAALPLWAVLGTLIVSEGAAALPVPAFMSFGLYEAGGTASLALLGFAAADAALAMLVVHIASQAMDYTLGGISFLLLTYLAPRRAAAGEGPAVAPAPRPRSIRGWILPLALAAIALLLAAGTAKRYKDLGALTPPEPGRESVADGDARSAVSAQLEGEKGFVVWSSNRFGSHDILRMDLPGMTISRLTRDDHTDTYPRISPDGRLVVFCRSRLPWVSQRDPSPWDIYLLDLETGKERRLAEYGFQPSWSDGGAAVIFVRRGTQVVEHRLEDGAETVLIESGQGGMPDRLNFQTPSRHPDRPEIAVTVRGRRRAAALVRPGGGLEQVVSGGGCQITWSPDGTFVYWADQPGRMGLGFYTLRPGENKPAPWLDLPGEHSHQYFPRLSADGRFLVMGASSGGHEHDTEDYEIFLWRTDSRPAGAARLTFHSGNDCWPDVFIRPAE